MDMEVEGLNTRKIWGGYEVKNGIGGYSLPNWLGCLGLRSSKGRKFL